ncbi:hypothetical protein JCM3774_005149 [Rhodotorula dairenensis]
MPPRPLWRESSAPASESAPSADRTHARAGPLITADLDSTPQETFLRLLESAQAQASASADSMDNRDQDADMSPPPAPSRSGGGGGSSSGETLAALMLAERHAARQRQRARADAIRRELEWDAADTRHRRNSLLSAVTDARAPWDGADAWNDFDLATGDADASSDLDDHLAAMLEEEEEDSQQDSDDSAADDDGEHDGDHERPDEGSLADFFSHGDGYDYAYDFDYGFDAGAAFPRSDAEHNNALAALLQVGGGPGPDDDLDFEFGTAEGDNDDEDLAMQSVGDDRGGGAAVGSGLVAANRRTANRLPSPRNESDIQRDLDALLQGRLLSTEPLNFSPRAGRAARLRGSDPGTATATRRTSRRSNDPSSALSYTSFFQPGTSFVGEQRFPSARERLSHNVLAAAAPASGSDGFTIADDPLRFDLRRWREAHGFSASSASVGAARPGRSAAPSGERTAAAASGLPPPWHARFDTQGRPIGYSTTLDSRADRDGDEARRDGNGGRASETSPLLGGAGSNRPRASNLNRYAPYSVVTGSPTSVQPQPGAPPALGAAIVPPASSGTGSLDSLAAQAGVPGVVSVVLSDDFDPRQPPRPITSRNHGSVPTADRGGSSTRATRDHDKDSEEAEEEPRERWGVKVSIDTYDPVQRQLSGFMAAHGITVASRTDVPISVHSPTTKSDITTFFTGQILHPILDGIFSAPPVGSRTSNLVAGASRLCSSRSRLTRSHEADGWVQIGPFKGMRSGELLERAKDRQWIQEVSAGWVLCRWKEKEFINVAAKDAPLSISGHYQLALDRRTGFLEGLYIDPFAAPQQRLVLSPALDESGAIGFGAYDYR